MPENISRTAVEWSASFAKKFGFAEQTLVNPFKDGAMSTKKPQEILELRMHLREKVGATSVRVRRLERSYNTQ